MPSVLQQRALHREKIIFVEEIMFLITDNAEILNFDNVVSIKANDYSDNEVAIKIVTTAIKHEYNYHIGSSYNPYCEEFTMEKKEWLELLEAIKNNKKVYELTSYNVCD
jgi:hypothetical protein